MHKLTGILFIGLSALVQAGCGTPHREEANRYVEAARTVLISNGICANHADCRSKNLIFYDDVGYFYEFYRRDVVFVKIYETRDEELVEALVRELQKTQRSVQSPSAVLIAYRSKHSEWNKVFKRVEI